MTTRKSTRPASAAKAASPTPKKTAKKRAKLLQGKAKVLSSELAFQGPTFAVFTDTLIEPGGHKNVRNVIRHHGSVVVLAADEAADPLILMVRQYRHAAGQFLLELPAGHIDPGESAPVAAKRELMEETGFRARRWTRLTTYYASPGFLGETMTIYLAQGLAEGASTPMEDENIELERVPLSRLLAMIRAGRIKDGKTIVGALLFADRRRS